MQAVLADSSVAVERWRLGSGRFSFLKDTAGKQHDEEQAQEVEVPLKPASHNLELGELRSDPFNDLAPESGPENDSLKVSLTGQPQRHTESSSPSYHGLDPFSDRNKTDMVTRPGHQPPQLKPPPPHRQAKFWSPALSRPCASAWSRSNGLVLAADRGW